MQDQLIKVYASNGPNLYFKTSFWKGFVIQGSKQKSQLLCLFVKMAEKHGAASILTQYVTISSGRFLTSESAIVIQVIFTDPWHHPER